LAICQAPKYNEEKMIYKIHLFMASIHGFLFDSTIFMAVFLLIIYIVTVGVKNEK